MRRLAILFMATGAVLGITGTGGSGKSSLFKVITGDLTPTAGSVARKPGLRHALLDQHRAFEGATTVWQAAAAAWREVIALEQSIAAFRADTTITEILGDDVCHDLCVLAEREWNAFITAVTQWDYDRYLRTV